MKKIISLFLALAFFVVSAPNAHASEKPFHLSSLQKAVQSLTKEYGEKKLYDASLISLGNQLIRLNKELASSKRPMGYDYYSLQVFSDGTGEFLYMDSSMGGFQKR